METTTTTAAAAAAVAAAQSIVQKVAPAALEDVLNGLRLFSINFDTAVSTTTTSTSTSASHDSTSAAAAAKKYCIPFDTIIESTDVGEKPFIACYYNKVPSSSSTSNSGNTGGTTQNNRYRSPWTNAIHPKVSNTETTTTVTKTNEKLRALEKSFNDVWESYKNLYYGHGDTISSVYLKELSNASFQGMFGIRKRIVSDTSTPSSNTNKVSKWDSVSYVIVDEISSDNKECTYRVETYVRVVLVPEVGNDDNTTSSKDTTTTTTTTADISILMSKETISTIKVYPEKIPINVSHIENVGTIIEENEMELRSVMESVYIPKNYETLCTLQKQPQSQSHHISNPVMNVMINSTEFKKRSEQQQSQQSSATETTATNSSSSTPMRQQPKIGTNGMPSGGSGGGINPLMASAMNSKILLKKRQQQEQQE